MRGVRLEAPVQGGRERLKGPRKQSEGKLGAGLHEDIKCLREKRARHTGGPRDLHKEGSQKGMDQTVQARPRHLGARVGFLTKESVSLSLGASSEGSSRKQSQHPWTPGT